MNRLGRVGRVCGGGPRAACGQRRRICSLIQHFAYVRGAIAGVLTFRRLLLFNLRRLLRAAAPAGIITNLMLI